MTVLQVEQKNSRLDLRLNRPEKRNALNSELVNALTKQFEDLSSNMDVKVVVLSGNGQDFCSGADLESLRKIADSSYEENLDDANELLRLFVAIRKCPVPIIAMVHGKALAGGCGLATACDIVVASEESVFGYPEVHIGFVPALVSAITRRNLSEKRAFELLTLGSRFDAKTAMDYGMINRVVASVELKTVTDSIAETYTKLPKGAVAATKNLLYDLDNRPFQESLKVAAEVNAKARMTDECKEGIERFLKKDS
jgi:methylglutaconyl-CoA hydratase